MNVLLNKRTENQQKKHLLKSKGALPLPVSLTYEPTARCNLQCRMCHRDTAAAEKELTLSEISRFVKALPESVKTVYLCGGEPLLREDIVDICRIFREREISLSLQTNGAFVERTLELAKIPGLKLLFSLDGPPEIHDRIRGCPSLFENNMKIFRALPERTRSEFIITSVICEDNYRDLIDLARLLAQEGLKPCFWIIEFARRYTKEIVKQSEELLGMPGSMPLLLKDSAIPPYSLEDFLSVMKELDAELKKKEFRFAYFPVNLLERAQDFYCRTYRTTTDLYCSHLDRLRISSSGDVHPCFAIRKSFGNILEQPLEIIWNSPEFRNFRTNLLENNLAPICETCHRAIDNSYCSPFPK